MLVSHGVRPDGSGGRGTEVLLLDLGAGICFNTRAARMAAPPLRTAGADSHAGFGVRATPLQGRLNGNGREFEDFLVLQVGVGSAVSASLARQIENAVDWPDRVEGAGVAALERHLARPVVVDPVLVA